MSRIKNLKAFYNSELLPNLNRIEDLRKGILTRAVLCFLATGILFPTLAYYIVKSINDLSVLLYFIPLFLLVAAAVYMLFDSIIKNSTFYNEYKRNVIRKLINYIEPSLQYDKQHFISHRDYDTSKLFPKEEVFVEGDDHVSGMVDEVKMEFSEFSARYKKAADRRARGHENQFQGMFFVAECPNPFPADIIVEPRNANTGTIPGQVILETDNAQFNEHFIIRLPNTDWLERARDMVDEDFLSIMNTFRSRMHNEIRISFIYNKLYMAISHDGELFEPKLMSPVANFDEVLIHFSNLFYPIALIEKLAAHRPTDMPNVVEEARNYEETAVN